MKPAFPTRGMRLGVWVAFVLALATLPLAERRQLAGLEPERADVIVAGACILVEIAAWTGAGDVVVSDRGVRWGLIRSLTQGSSQASPF